MSGSRDDPLVSWATEPSLPSVRARVPEKLARVLRARQLPRSPILVAARPRAPDRGVRLPGCARPRDEVDRSTSRTRGEPRLPAQGLRPRRAVSPPLPSHSSRSPFRPRVRASQRPPPLDETLRRSSAGARRRSVLGALVRRLGVFRAEPRERRSTGRRLTLHLARSGGLEASRAHRSCRGAWFRRGPFPVAIRSGARRIKAPAGTTARRVGAQQGSPGSLAARPKPTRRYRDARPCRFPIP